MIVTNTCWICDATAKQNKHLKESTVRHLYWRWKNSAYSSILLSKDNRHSFRTSEQLRNHHNLPPHNYCPKTYNTSRKSKYLLEALARFYMGRHRVKGYVWGSTVQGSGRHSQVRQPWSSYFVPNSHVFTLTHSGCASHSAGALVIHWHVSQPRSLRRNPNSQYIKHRGLLSHQGFEACKSKQNGREC